MRIGEWFDRLIDPARYPGGSSPPPPTIEKLDDPARYPGRQLPGPIRIVSARRRRFK